MSNLVPIKPVKSTAIQGEGYSEEHQVLALQFAGGSLHHFRGVTPEDYAAFQAAESKGRHYATHIRGRFDSEPVDQYLNEKA